MSRGRYGGTSPTGRLIHLAVTAVEHFIKTGDCLMCSMPDGRHSRDCDVGEAAEETLQARANVNGGHGG